MASLNTYVVTKRKAQLILRKIWKKITLLAHLYETETTKLSVPPCAHRYRCFIKARLWCSTCFVYRSCRWDIVESKRHKHSNIRCYCWNHSYASFYYLSVSSAIVMLYLLTNSMELGIWSANSLQIQVNISDLFYIPVCLCDFFLAPFGHDVIKIGLQFTNLWQIYDK